MTEVSRQHLVTAYNTAKYGVQTHRPGLNIAFENRVHDDDVARLFGFASGLVPGVDIYAYMARLPVAEWGVSFLERRRMSCRFVNKPPPKGGGFKLRLKAGSVRLRRTQTTLKSSSGSGGVWFWHEV